MWIEEFTGAGGVGNTVSGLPWRPGILMTTDNTGPTSGRMWATETTNKYDDMWSWSSTTPVTGFGELTADGWTGSSTYWTTSGVDYQVFHWPAGSGGVINNDGTIASEVYNSPISGTACGRYYGNGLGSATVGHGMGAQPCLLLIWGDCQDIRNGRIWAPTFGTHPLGTWSENGGETGDNGIVTANTTTFELDGILATNELGSAMDWVAFTDTPGKIASGSVNGDNVSTVTVTGLGFEPRLMILLGRDGGVTDARGQYAFTYRDGQTAPYFANYRTLNSGYSTPNPQPVSTDVQFLADGFSIEPGFRGNNGTAATWIAFA